MNIIKGIPASEGIVIGPAYVYRPQALTIPRYTAADFAAEWSRLETALAQATQELQSLRDKMAQEAGEEEAQIFDAHIMMLADPTLTDEIKALLERQNLNAEAALNDALKTQIAMLEALDDPYFAARATDLRDIARRVTRILLGAETHSLADMTAPAVLIAHDLTPSDTASLNKEFVLGFCTAVGGPTAHTAILARSLNLPAIVGAGDAVLQIQAGETLILDGGSGQVIVSPDAETQNSYRQRRAELIARQSAAREAAQSPALSKDGRRVEVAANIGGPEEIEGALHFGAEGVGLLRTEFFYLERSAPPTEEEQFAAYRRIAEALGQRPLVIRTLDIGGDKALPYLSMQPEENPFLGLRGIRLCLVETELFKTQLRAILRAAKGYNIKIMFPMVATADEIKQGKALLNEARAELEARNLAYGEPEVGIMIEVPAAALTADLLAREVDFFSIGTNDLTQYTLAADRTNAQVQPLANALHPAVLRLIAETIRQAHKAGIWVGLCGELAGNPQAAPILLGLGLDEFSMSAASIPAVKAALRRYSVAEAKALAQAALQQIW
ncbi:MAG TPA: phosphoenolpyruvate--protein phosphotransferase [Anaerolineae bacterium]|nr:phosphoenolpyruvate--protein phosphotransferase [Anaerolineae bacterium]